jgi:hypothetical protein
MKLPTSLRHAFCVKFFIDFPNIFTYLVIYIRFISALLVPNRRFFHLSASRRLIDANIIPSKFTVIWTIFRMVLKYRKRTRTSSKHHRGVMPSVACDYDHVINSVFTSTLQRSFIPRRTCRPPLAGLNPYFVSYAVRIAMFASQIFPTTFCNIWYTF